MRRRPLSPAQLLSLHIVALATVGTILLRLPIATEPGRHISLVNAFLFETTSAFGTVGLSTGHAGSILSLSGHFSWAGKLLISLMMFMGRMGPLTLAVALTGGQHAARVRYPEGKVLIG